MSPDFSHCPTACYAEGQHVCTAEAAADIRAEDARQWALWSAPVYEQCTSVYEQCTSPKKTYTFK